MRIAARFATLYLAPGLVQDLSALAPVAYAAHARVRLPRRAPHRRPGEDSRLLFFELDELREGDEIDLEDLSGNAYRYRVEELFRVGPYDAWVADRGVDRGLLTLQSCTYPDFEDRIVVRADRSSHVTAKSKSSPILR